MFYKAIVTQENNGYVLAKQGCKLTKLMDFRLGSVTLQPFLVGNCECRCFVPS